MDMYPPYFNAFIQLYIEMTYFPYFNVMVQLYIHMM